MATTFESTRPVQQMEIVGAPTAADPAPLGLAAFALTTFLLSVHNAGWTRGTGLGWVGYALAYGGAAQLLAGMWEFKNRNVFGATAFGTYGGFWIGLGLYALVGAPHATGHMFTNDLAWIALAFFIFNTYMLLWSLFVNQAVLAVFFTLEITFLLLFIGNFSSTTNLVKAGGIVGVVTAAVAWYTSAAGVVNGMAGRHILYVGKPMSFPAARSSLH